MVSRTKFVVLSYRFCTDSGIQKSSRRSLPFRCCVQLALLTQPPPFLLLVLPPQTSFQTRALLRLAVINSLPSASVSSLPFPPPSIFSFHSDGVGHGANVLRRADHHSRKVSSPSSSHLNACVTVGLQTHALFLVPFAWCACIKRVRQRSTRADRNKDRHRGKRRTEQTDTVAGEGSR